MENKYFHMAKGEMLICTEHEEYPVPLIHTLVFIGAEAWCPFCGDTGSVFNRKRVIATPELEQRREKYIKATSDFLSAKSTLSCLIFLGKRITTSELPADEKIRCEEIIKKGWSKNIKAEEING